MRLRILALIMLLHLFNPLVETSTYQQTYRVSVTRKCTNLYGVDGTNYFIQTRFCFEYSYSEEALIRNYSPYGYSKGELCFVGNGDYDDCYDIAEVYLGEIPSVPQMKVLTMADMIEDIQLILVPTQIKSTK